MLTAWQERALAVISKRRKSSPIIGKKIALEIGLKERDSGKEGADMRSIVHALRVKGYPICADSRGYYYASSRRELEEYTESLRGRIRKEQEAVTGLVSSAVWFKPWSEGGELLPEERQKTLL